MPLPDNAVILFQGDSITDANRGRNDADRANSPHALGVGYVSRIAGQLLADHPERGWRIFNRGISGDKVTDLYARWRRDATNLAPALISILIGVNDVGQQFLRQDGVDADRFETVYRLMLDDTRQRLGTVQLVLGQPFALAVGGPGADWEAWSAALAERQAIIARLAQEYQAILVPYHEVFTQACQQAPPSVWSGDGIHPGPAGHELMARAWLEACAGAW